MPSAGKDAAAGTSQERVAIVTLGCARNEVDSEELAHRLAADGWQVVADPQQADARPGEYLWVRGGGEEGLD